MNNSTEYFLRYFRIHAEKTVRDRIISPKFSLHEDMEQKYYRREIESCLKLEHPEDRLNLIFEEAHTFEMLLHDKELGPKMNELIFLAQMKGILK